MPGTSNIEFPATADFRLDDWLRWQESLNPRLVDLGLDRCARVAARMGLEALPMPVVTVAGTNGKGSCIAYLTGILEGAGHPVAAYTSPFLVRYNESLRLYGREVEDGELIAAFENVERARERVALTFFEFRTLAAMDIIRRSQAAVALLEVGLGGRLDAVNLMDADVAVVTSVDLDHTDWLGPDRESIGREKAGIFRSGRPAVCADPSPPVSLVEHARTLGADLHAIGCEFSWRQDGPGWSWQGPGTGYRHLPAPGMGGAFQHRNAAAALMALQLLGPSLAVDGLAVREGIANAWLPARQQILAGAVERVIDVAHNAEAARALAATLAARPPARRTHAVFAMLADKDATTVAGALDGLVDEWHTATLPGPRGQSGERLADGLRRQFPGHPVSVHADVAGAWTAVLAAARRGDRVVAFGSFLTAREVLSVENG
ncbi:MAG: bifunctional tetrahydrofolate synthase/dihydrofolate synthase [Gammaproteobacteria bacterium]|nr:MAG: bifunctional tetrahydrofolate synthase/dihydrofolate synthase [Gammaproteobacteria bacterium]